MDDVTTKNIPDDYVIATGEQYTVREFIDNVAKELEMEIQWVGEGLNEKGFGLMRN